jgi:drug/metabolite transporter (DMT)-like permease
VSEQRISTAVDNNQHNHTITKEFYIGLCLALTSSLFIGSSFILKKKGLLKLISSDSSKNVPNNKVKRAGQGGYGYLKEWLWWSGLITMALGELCNFAAYGFVPATLVTPLGALSVLIAAILSAYFLDEKLSTIGKIGCFLTAIGSIIMVIHAPKEGEIKTVLELLGRLKDVEFVLFIIICIVSLFFLITVMSPKYGNTNVLIYLLICSILGSFTVMGCKGVSLGIKEFFLNQPSVSYMYTYLFALMVLFLIVAQMNYLNKSLDLFHTAVVTTVYYVLFTLFVMINSSLLFKELLMVSFEDFVGCLCGFSVIVCALFMIHFFKPTLNRRDLIEEENSSHLMAKPASFAVQSESEHTVINEDRDHNNLTSSTNSITSHEIRENIATIKPLDRQPKNRFNTLDSGKSKKQENNNNNSFLKRLTDKDTFKNYFNQFKSLNLTTSPKYNMLLANDDDEYHQDTTNETKKFEQNNYAKLRHNNDDFEDEDSSDSLQIKKINNINFFNKQTKKESFNSHKHKNSSFDANFFEVDENKENLLSTSLNIRR